MYYLIDIGSSTVKVYVHDKQKVVLKQQRTFNFKDGFTEEGLSGENKKALFDFFSSLVDNYSLTNKNTKIYATGIFRSIVNKHSFIEEFFQKTGLYFNIISQDLEAFYLEKAWINSNCSLIRRMLIINIGGKTTELLICENGKVIDTPIKLNIGVGAVMKRYPDINDTYSPYPIEKVVKDLADEIKSIVPSDGQEFEAAIYTGGELNYMRCAGYPLIDNTMFQDTLHPSMIRAQDYFNRNMDVFSSITISELKSMMPQNPEWMSGARPCSALAEAIIRSFNVKIVIPSDSNLIDGVNIQEASSVVLCGSFNRYLSEIASLKQWLNNKGISVLSPKSTEIIGDENGFILFKDDIIINHNTWTVEKKHLDAIDACDFVIACNFENYIGVTTTFELEHAYNIGKKIVFVEDNEIATTFGDRIGKHPFPCEIGLLK